MLHKKIDYIYIMLLSLILISLSVIFYFYKMDKAIKEYQEYQHQLESLMVIDKEFDNFLLHKFSYINYDKIASLSDQFEQTLKSLERAKIYSSFGKHFQQSLQEIEKIYEDKHIQIEEFKAINSSSVNSLAYLFELTTLITKDENISQQTDIDVQKITYYITQLSLNVHLDHQKILKQLSMLKPESELIKYYTLQTKFFLKNMKKFSLNKEATSHLDLYQEINNFSNALADVYHTQREENRNITTTFFMTTLLMLIILTRSYYQLKKSNREALLYTTIFKNTQEGILLTDKEGTILSANRALEQQTGYSEHQMIGHTPNIFSSKNHDKFFYVQMWEQILKNEQWSGRIENRHQNGSIYPVWLRISAIKDHNGEIINYFSTHTDLREIINSQEKIEYIAYHDTLTQLDNRLSFERQFEHAIQRSKRSKQRLALLFIDLDRFKDINDSLGHNIGDKLLIKVGTRIQKALRDSDILARIGGDEFMVCLEDVTKNANASDVASKILQSLNQVFFINGYELNTTASIGISFYPDDAQDLQSLLKFSDSAMYKAKDLGKNTYAFYDASLYEHDKQRLDLESALRVALKNQELYLNYQPKYELESRQTVSAEALIRWRHPEFGLIAPDIFIPIAEESGLIIDIGYFVFEESCKMLCELRSRNITLENIAINLSSNQFKDAKLLDNFSNILAHYELSAKDIEIEITERTIMQDNQKNLQLLNTLQKNGYHISIDDFGTGYSSMSYLKTFPIDIIKIDKSFVDNLPHDANDSAITKAILALSKSLGYENIAEGIESLEQEDYLRDNGCKYGQGFCYSKPLNSDDFLTFLENQGHLSI